MAVCGADFRDYIFQLIRCDDLHYSLDSVIPTCIVYKIDSYLSGSQYWEVSIPKSIDRPGDMNRSPGRVTNDENGRDHISPRFPSRDSLLDMKALGQRLFLVPKHETCPWTGVRSQFRTSLENTITIVQLHL